VLVTVLPGPTELNAALAADAGGAGDAGALARLRTGALWIDLTSGDPRVTDVLAALAESRGIAVLAAPMGGGPSAAESRSLRFFVGGSGAAVERGRPLLGLLGGIHSIAPRPGDAQLAKLLANLLWFGQAIAVTEALLLGQARGLDPAGLARTLAGSAGGSAFLDEYLDRLLDGNNLATFGLDRVVEELETVAAIARDAGVPFELSQQVVQLHRAALERFGAVDGELLAARLLEERAGRTLRR
jgi:3-hydroxyisobutyrate dehydrogenase-like beta-hydroxyacid dehydrogenase